MGWMTEETWFSSQQKQDVFSSTKPPHRIWKPPSVVFTTYRRTLLQQEIKIATRN